MARSGQEALRCRVELGGAGLLERKGMREGAAFCDDHATFYLLDTVTPTELRNSSGAGKKGWPLENANPAEWIEGRVTTRLRHPS